MRLADYAGTGVTVGRHPMAHCRDQLRSINVCRVDDLLMLRHGVKVRIAGCVIARQRPGTAHGFIFLSIETRPASRTQSSTRNSTSSTAHSSPTPVSCWLRGRFKTSIRSSIFERVTLKNSM
jgi:hypothetical protein